MSASNDPEGAVSVKSSTSSRRRRENHGQGRVPRWSRAIVALATASGDRQPLLDDLAEEFCDRVETEGYRAARRWYRRQVLSSVGPLLGRRIGSRLARPKAVLGAASVSGMLRNLRFASRNLRRNPGFAAVIVAVLAIGIGANTAIFSLVAPFLFRALPYADAERLVHMFETYPEHDSIGWDMMRQALPTLRDWQETADSFEGIAAYFYGNAAVRVDDGEPQRIEIAYVSANLLPLLGAEPAAGRHFDVSEDAPGRNDVVLIAHSLWRGMFGGDDAILGRSVKIEGREHVVVGVMPPDFSFPFGGIRMWKPAALTEDRWDRDDRGILTMGRLRPGADVDSATAELRGIQERLRAEFPAQYEGYGVRVVPLKQALIFFYDLFAALMLSLLASVAIVLLIVCANVANLTLSHANRRARDVAIGIALGARRSQIAGQLLAESLLLAVLGGVLGVALAQIGVGAVSNVVPAALYRVGEIRIDGSALVYTAVVAALTAIVFGLVPALRATRHDVSRVLKAGGIAATVGSRRRLNRGLVFGQVLLATVLCGVAVLAVQANRWMGNADLGLQAGGVITVEASLATNDYPTRAEVESFFSALVVRVEALAPVRSASLINWLPLNFESGVAWYHEPGAPALEPQDRRGASLAFVAPDYFETMGVRLLGGRDFDERDTGEAGSSVIVNELLAARLWTRPENAVGQTVVADWGTGDEEATVVGVVDGTVAGFLLNGIGEQIYVPASRRMPYRNFLVVRVDGDPAAATGAIRAQFADLDPNLPVASIRMMDTVVDGTSQPVRVASMLLSAFSGFALVLAAIGVYGVVAYAVTRRQHEIGVRMALGARATDVVRLVVRAGAPLVLAGAVVGGGVTFAISLALASAVGEESASVGGPVTAVLLLVAVALLACWLPARRAVRIEPARALRAE